MGKMPMVVLCNILFLIKKTRFSFSSEPAQGTSVIIFRPRYIVHTAAAFTATWANYCFSAQLNHYQGKSRQEVPPTPRGYSTSYKTRPGPWKKQLPDVSPPFPAQPESQHQLDFVPGGELDSKKPCLISFPPKKGKKVSKSLNSPFLRLLIFHIASRERN